MRRAFALLLAVAALLASAPARAGTYLDAAALLLDETRRASEWIQTHPTDRDLAALAHAMAEGRVKAARKLAVPKDLERAHPHFLLTLEVAERAMAAAEAGELPRFLRLMVEARDEERTFRAVLGQLDATLPALDKKRER